VPPDHIDPTARSPRVRLLRFDAIALAIVILSTGFLIAQNHLTLQRIDALRAPLLRLECKEVSSKRYPPGGNALSINFISSNPVQTFQTEKWAALSSPSSFFECELRNFGATPLSLVQLEAVAEYDTTGRFGPIWAGPSIRMYTPGADLGTGGGPTQVYYFCNTTRFMMKVHFLPHATLAIGQDTDRITVPLRISDASDVMLLPPGVEHVTRASQAPRRY
jgi:hypothetical protein